MSNLQDLVDFTFDTTTTDNRVNIGYDNGKKLPNEFHRERGRIGGVIRGSQFSTEHQSNAGKIGGKVNSKRISEIGKKNFDRLNKIKVECEHCKLVTSYPQHSQSHGDECSWRVIDMNLVYNDLKSGMSIPKVMCKYGIKNIMCRNLKQGKYPNYPKLLVDSRNFQNDVTKNNRNNEK